MKWDIKRSDCEKIMNVVIPELTVLKAMLTIRDIEDRKAVDKVKETEKKARRALYGEDEEEEEEKEDPVLKAAMATMTSTMKSGKKKKMVEIDPEELERLRAEHAFQQELKEYGVRGSIVEVRSSNLIRFVNSAPGFGRTTSTQKVSLRVGKLEPICCATSTFRCWRTSKTTFC